MNLYTKMQQKIYDKLAAKDAVQRGFLPNEQKSGMVLGLEAHNNCEEYENLWKDISDLESKDVLDFGCGPGRNLIHYHNIFKSIDGVDLAEKNLTTARKWIRGAGLDPIKFRLFKNDGVSLDCIHDESYDVIMSTICMQHISVHEIRYGLLEEFYRVLRPSGYVTLQFLLTADKPGTVKYYDNYYDASDTNGAADCVVENPEYVEKDLEAIGFTNFHSYIRPAAEVMGPSTDKEWVFINAQKVLT